MNTVFRDPLSSVYRRATLGGFTSRAGEARNASREGVTIAEPAERQTPEQTTTDDSAAPTQQSLFRRAVSAVPGALTNLASSTAKALKEVFLEGLVTYFVFSRAGNLAGSISRATGADFNGIMGVLTVPVRKLATKAVRGLVSMLPELPTVRDTPAAPSTQESIVEAPAVEEPPVEAPVVEKTAVEASSARPLFGDSFRRIRRELNPDIFDPTSEHQTGEDNNNAQDKSPPKNRTCKKRTACRPRRSARTS